MKNKNKDIKIEKIIITDINKYGSIRVLINDKINVAYFFKDLGDRLDPYFYTNIFDYDGTLTKVEDIIKDLNSRIEKLLILSN